MAATNRINDIGNEQNTGGPSNGSGISAIEARAALEQERQQRVEECRQELAAVLAKHRCDLDVSMLIRQDRIVPQIAIVAKD